MISWRYMCLNLTSAPEENFMSVHIRCSDPRTRRLANLLGCKFDNLLDKTGTSAIVGLRQNLEDLELNPNIKRILPPISIDGPFGSPGDHIFDHKIAVLVGGGSGVAPFASVLKSIWYRMSNPQKGMQLRKVYFFCVLEDFVGYEWFRSLLMAIEARDIDYNIGIHTVSKAIVLKDTY